MEILPRRITIKWLVYLIDRIGILPLLKPGSLTLLMLFSSSRRPILSSGPIGCRPAETLTWT